MRPINLSAEKAVIDVLERNGSCSLDDLVMQLPNFSRSDVFLAVDRMSRESLVVLRRLRGSYHIALASRPVRFPVPARQKEPQT